MTSDTKSPKPSTSKVTTEKQPPKPTLWVQGPTIAQLKALLDHINPYCNDEDRDRVIMALHHETDGSDDGLIITDEWLRKGDNYPGLDGLAIKWKSLENHTEDPVTVEILRKMVTDNGFDLTDICSRTETDSEPSESTIIKADEQTPVTPPAPATLLDKYSIKGMRSQLMQYVVKQVFALEPLALMGQATVIYGSPGTGKTLITLRLVADAVSQGEINPAMLYYFNADDSITGLLEKLEYADEFDYHTLAEGYKGFKTSRFLEILTDLTENDQANGLIVILDTGKKFVDPMDKRKSRIFGKHIRLFIMKGGTCIVLAHTNKYCNNDGKPIYAGTSDIVEDFDCAFLMYEVGIDADTETKTIQLENIKSRGNVAKQASYRYSIAEGLSYRELLDSVIPVDDTELVAVKQAAEFESDAEVINAISQCIREGINTKMKLAKTVAEQTGISKRSALRLIEKYAGTDPEMHKWTCTVQDRGAKVYSLLAPDTAVSDHVVKP